MADATADASSRRLDTVRSKALNLLQGYGILLLLAALVAAVAIGEPAFLTSRNLLNLLQQWAPIGIMAMAGTFVMIGGGFDLSVGGIFVLAGVMFAGLTRDGLFEFGVPVALIVGLGLGIANGLIITRAGVNAFIATIGMGQVARGLALIYSGAAPIILTDNAAFGVLGQSRVGQLAWSAVILVGLFLIGGAVLSRSVYGRTVYAVGGNPAASRLSGIAVERVLVGTYAISGIAAALAGMIFFSRLGISQADAAVLIEVDVIIAIVLGGTAVGGGVGAMWRTAVGVAILAVMENGFDTLNLGSFYQDVIKGSILVAAVAWDVWSRRRKGAAAAAVGGTDVGTR